MNREDFKRAGLYDMLVEVTGNKRNTIKQYFCNHKMDVTDPLNFITYWNKYDYIFNGTYNQTTAIKKTGKEHRMAKSNIPLNDKSLQE